LQCHGPSRCIREEFDNGKHCYALHGQQIVVPDSVHHRPDPAALRWHNESCFKV
jgi:putative restriction endonuclease